MGTKSKPKDGFTFAEGLNRFAHPGGIRRAFGKFKEVVERVTGGVKEVIEVAAGVGVLLALSSAFSPLPAQSTDRDTLRRETEVQSIVLQPSEGFPLSVGTVALSPLPSQSTEIAPLREGTGAYNIVLTPLTVELGAVSRGEKNVDEWTEYLMYAEGFWDKENKVFTEKTWNLLKKKGMTDKEIKKAQEQFRKGEVGEELKKAFILISQSPYSNFEGWMIDFSKTKEIEQCNFLFKVLLLFKNVKGVSLVDTLSVIAKKEREKFCNVRGQKKAEGSARSGDTAEGDTSGVPIVEQSPGTPAETKPVDTVKEGKQTSPKEAKEITPERSEQEYPHVSLGSVSDSNEDGLGGTAAVSGSEVNCEEGECGEVDVKEQKEDTSKHDQVSEENVEEGDSSSSQDIKPMSAEEMYYQEFMKGGDNPSSEEEGNKGDGEVSDSESKEGPAKNDDEGEKEEGDDENSVDSEDF